MHNLSGKKVLFFYLSTFGYEAEIQKAMKHEGAFVDSYNERPTNNIFARILIRLNRDLINKYIDNYYNRIIEQTKNRKYDFIFFIKGESVSKSIVEKLRIAHPEAKNVIYHWDSIANNRNAKGMLDSFDKIFSFDKNDCKEFGMSFLPLFYTSQYEEIANSNIPEEYDLMFVGTTHSERYEFVNDIAEQIRKIGGKCFTWFYFPNRINFYKLKWDNPRFRKAKINDFHFTPMQRNTLLEHYIKSRIQIDMQHPKQTGLTMRTIESLGAKKKLITTNVNVVDYDFYNPDNILIVDRENPIIANEFISSPWNEISENVYKKYSISSWLNNIFSEN